MTTYYGRAAYEGFARAFAAKMGVNVRVDSSSSGASVDSAGTIYLPDMDTYQTKEEFEGTCATVIHEVSHVVYGSHKEFANHAGKSRLWRDCLNAVMDVADETAIGQREHAAGNTRAEELLVRSNVRAASQPSLSSRSTAPAHWQILVNGIIRARINCKIIKVRGARNFGYTPKRQFPNVDVDAAFKTIGNARLKDRQAGNHARLIKLADKLAEILESVAPPDSEPETPMPGGAGSATGKGTDSLPSGGTLAGAGDGEQIANGGTPGGAGGKKRSGNGIPACRASSAMLLPAVRRVAERIALDGESIDMDGGYFSGTTVKDAFKVFTDGACMGRWQTDEHSDGMAVAVLLDVSGSMGYQMATVAGVADAFAKGMTECATVRLWTFGEDVNEVADFSEIEMEGNTQTHLAVKAGREWLQTESAGRKLIVCLTDGQPYSTEQTQSECRQAEADGIGIWGVALGFPAAALVSTLPGARICQADDAPRLAIALETICLSV